MKEEFFRVLKSNILTCVYTTYVPSLNNNNETNFKILPTVFGFLPPLLSPPPEDKSILMNTMKSIEIIFQT